MRRQDCPGYPQAGTVLPSIVQLLGPLTIGMSSD